MSVKSSLAHIQKHKTGFYLLLILLLTFLVYSTSIFNGFLFWDDDQNVYQNPAITNLNFAHIKQFFSSFYIGMYQPLTTLSYALNYKITAMNPAGFHAGNLLFHLLNTLLVFIFIRGISKKSSVALLTALFFGIHPMFVESVAWVSERKDVLYTFFFLLSLIFYVAYVGKKKGLIFLFGSFLMFVARFFRSRLPFYCLQFSCLSIGFCNGNLVGNNSQKRSPS